MTSTRKTRVGRNGLAAPWQRWGGYALLAVALLALVVFLFFRGSRRETYGEPWLEFSGKNALAQTQKLVDFGPRPPGSAALKDARVYIKEQLEKFGWQVELQTFTDDTPRGKVAFVNLIARQPNESKRGKLFLLCSHYDTKSFDSIRFVGADDGGSSTGALLEMARVLSLHPRLASHIELVFFDGEEAYNGYSKNDGLYGSRYFAKQIKKTGTTKRYRGGILWDMIGDRNLTITLSPDSPEQLTRDIFAAAVALNARDHFTYATSNTLDDHNALNEIGIPTIDLIDFDYPPWHTAEDTMDKLSAESLQTVGAVTAYYLAEMAFR
ncbi:MAG: M28 family peptidase [Chthoniobacterales bacterium]